MNVGRAFLLIFILLSLFSHDSQAQAGGSLRLATGPRDGTYNIIGETLRRIIEASSPQTQVQLFSTNGSINNLEMLERHEADFALVQSDVAAEVVRQYQQQNLQLPWRTVLVLTQEPVQIVVGPSLREDSLEALSARPLALGTLNNEGHFTASQILNALQIGYSEVAVESATDEAEKLRQQSAQAAFFVSNMPDPQVAALLADPSNRLLSFNTQEMGALHDSSPYYATITIPENTYPNQNRSVATISVLTVLLCRADLPDGTVEQIARALLQSAASSAISRRTQFSLNLSEVLQFTNRSSIPLHPGTERALESIPFKLRVRAYAHWLQWGLFVLLACLAFITAYLRRPRLFLMRVVGRRLPLLLSRIMRVILFHRLLWQVVRTLSMFALLWLMGSAAMYLFEREVNTNFSNLKASSLSILVYLFSGLEDRAPVTNGGWIGSVIMLISGLLIAAYITGQFASEIMRQTLGVIQMSKNSAKNSMLVIGWNARAERVVREIFAAFDVDLEAHNVTVLSEERVDTHRYSEFESRGVTFVSGDAFDKKLLARIGAHNSHSIVVMADDKCEDPDAKSTLTVLALRSLFIEEGIGEDKRPRICAEVLNHRKMELIRDAGADEVVCHQDFGLGVLAQSAFAAKLTEVYQELLSYSVSSCEIYMLHSPHVDGDGDIPMDIWKGLFEGKTFAQAAELFVQNRNTDNPPILIGLQRGEQIFLNPRNRFELQQGDSLIVIAYVRPRFEHLRSLIESSKS